MPILSVYTFDTTVPNYGGPFRETHVPLDSEGFARVEIDDLACNPPLIFFGSGTRAVLAIARPDNEDVLDLAAMYNGFAVTNLPTVIPSQSPSVTAFDLVSGLLSKNGGSVRGPIRSTPLIRESVPSFLSLPPDAPDQVLTEMHIDFHLNTPGGCYAHEGTITVYVQFLLQRGSLVATPLASTYTPDINPDVCASGVNDALNKLIADPTTPGFLFLSIYFQRVVPAFLQSAIDRNPPTTGPNPPHHMRIYGLPGDGKRTGSGTGTSDTNFSIGLERSAVLALRASALRARPLRARPLRVQASQ